MSQIIDMYFRKLSTPVDTLDFSPRACRGLQRAGITTVAEIVLAGKSKIDSIRQMGPRKVDEVWRAAADYLNLSAEQLEQSASCQEETNHNTRENSVMALPLPPSTLEVISSLGINLIDDLVRIRTLEYCKFWFMSAVEIALIDWALCFNMTRSALIRLLPSIGTVEELDLCLMNYSLFKDRDLTLQLPGIHEQAWTVLELGTMQFLNPGEIAARADGLSQARVQKMITAAQERLHYRLFSLSIFLDHFEEQSKILEKGLEGSSLDLEILTTALLPDPTKSRLIIERQEVVRMILLVRSLVFYRVHWIWDEMVPKWLTFIYLSCMVTPDLKTCVRFKRMIVEMKRETNKNQHITPVVSILSQDISSLPQETKPDWQTQLSRINKRAWLILEQRTMQMLSLQKIGMQVGDISRERVQQIIKQAQGRLQISISSLNPFLDHLEERSEVLQNTLVDGLLSLDTLVHHLSSGSSPRDLILDERVVRQLIILIRSLVLYKSPWFWEEMEPRWQIFILLSCLVEPPLKKHERVKMVLEKQKPAKTKDGYQDLAYTVLVNAGKPLHWSNIAEQASQLVDCDRFSSKAILSTLQYNKQRFVRVGQGTYGLAEWDLQTPAPYTHVIASILKEENRPMSQDQIFARVSEFRPATWSSVNIVLSTHYRFYKSKLNTYGLRGWLPAIDRPDSPVADCLVEKPSSLNRVARARAMGLNIDKVIRQDKRQ